MTGAVCKPAQSIGARLSRQLFWQTAIGLSVLCLLIYGAAHYLFKVKHDEAIAVKLGAVQEIVRSAYQRGGNEEVATKLAYYAPKLMNVHVQVSDAKGATVYAAATDTNAWSGEPGFQLRDFNLASGDGSPPVLQGRVAFDFCDDARLMGILAGVLLLCVITGAASVGWATFWRVKRELQPLKALAQQTRAIAPDNLGTRLKLDQPVEEVQPWIDQFNYLMGRLERAYMQLEGFNADVAHELRTPLANLVGQTELALSRERSTESMRDTMLSNLEELQRMSALVNDMLFLSQADRGATARRGEPVQLSALVRQVLEFHEAPLEEAGLQVRIEGDATLPVDEALVKRAMSNLLGNATRFAQHGSTVVVRIAPEVVDAKQQVQVVVQNDGPAIEPEHLPRLFDRFFRGDESRCCPNEEQHHGLGLAIVAAIARMHAGQPMAVSARGITSVGFTLAAA
jgi:two-component system, OmpR family, heavy metal sensor histidine kinase CusS